MVNACTVPALQERKKLQHALCERPRTVVFQWVKGGRNLYIPQTFFTIWILMLFCLSVNFFFIQEPVPAWIITARWHCVVAEQWEAVG